MFLQSVLKQVGAVASILLISLSSSSEPILIPAEEAGTETTYQATLPEFVKPVRTRLDSYDNIVRKNAHNVIRAAKAKANNNSEAPVAPAVTKTASSVDSIHIADNLAIHPADTLNLYTDRYYALFEPGYMRPLVFDSFMFVEEDTIVTPDIYDIYFEDIQDPYTKYFESLAPNEGLQYLEDVNHSRRILTNARQTYMANHPEMVKYNLSQMPSPPRHFRAVVEPGTTNISIEEIDLTPAETKDIAGIEYKPIHWLHNFQSSLQFSQAYISPNWYQGGKNNLNAILNLYYNIKLNEKFHPNLLFDTTIQYKLGINSAPEDTAHNYNITEDLFQAYSKFGLKASNNWYYTVNMTFKTQLLNHYPINKNKLQSTFMTPGELNVGLGMTYSKNTPRLQFNASIAPLSYNLKTCLSRNDSINAENFGIKEGHRFKNEFGSSTELTFKWKWSYNINYSSRLFLFTNYQYAQGDWENTISFDINRFLSTQIYWHLRYDTQTDRIPDSDWHRFQFKEIFSLGFSYRFKNV